MSALANTKPRLGDETSTISTQLPIPGADISYSIRHVEESWHHLIKSDDNKKLKEIAVCNFDFLLAAVSSIIIVESTTPCESNRFLN
jgi:diketogulonate reductase-like aldo/keto reductase